MGVNPTPTNYKTFTFAGENSRNYGVYITGEGVFNAPERNVEMIDIPGRNGAFALDKGNFNNVEVTYPAGIVADTEADFAEAVSDLRNLLCSQTGYVRLEDDYNPNEYRMAIYKSGLEVSHDGLLTGEFDLTFDCKPQRYLKSGETAVSVTSGGTVTNPTRFASQPLLKVEGYGNINFNGYNIDIVNAMMGNVDVVRNSPLSASYTSPNAIFESASIPVEAFGNVGDTFEASVDISVNFSVWMYTNLRVSVTSQPSVGHVTALPSGSKINVKFSGASISGDTATDATANYTCGVSVTGNNKGTDVTFALPLTFDIIYDHVTNVITSTVSKGSSSSTTFDTSNIGTGQIVVFTLDSTTPLLGNPTYADCEVGECYKIVNDVVVPLNAYIDLGANLPVLASGANTITYDNTVTQLDIIPRWWKV